TILPTPEYPSSATYIGLLNKPSPATQIPPYHHANPHPTNIPPQAAYSMTAPSSTTPSPPFTHNKASSNTKVQTGAAYQAVHTPSILAVPSEVLAEAKRLEHRQRKSESAMHVLATRETQNVDSFSNIDIDPMASSWSSLPTGSWQEVLLSLSSWEEVLQALSSLCGRVALFVRHKEHIVGVCQYTYLEQQQRPLSVALSIQHAPLLFQLLFLQKPYIGPVAHVEELRALRNLFEGDSASYMGLLPIVHESDGTALLYLDDAGVGIFPKQLGLLEHATQQLAQVLPWHRQLHRLVEPPGIH
ncbi:MAG: hypothetical protein AAGJ35_07965, partial [Myxococcota bacterium]